MINQTEPALQTSLSGSSTPQDVFTVEDLFDFDKSQIRHKQLIGQWATELTLTERNRLRRNVDVDVTELRASGAISKDSTFITVRTIDKNIKREQPPYLNFLRNSRRLATFSLVRDRTVDTQRLEEDFTRGMTYSGWENPFFRELDGSQTHGWDSIEVVFDTTKPLHVAIEHIGHDKLIFPRDTINIQTCEIILRAYSITILELDMFVKRYGFDAEQMDKIKTTLKNNPDQKNVTIYKRYCKKDGIVYVSWLSTEYGVSSWLKAPMKLFLGRQTMQQVPPDPQQLIVSTLANLPPPQPTMTVVDEDEEQYPIFILPYNETEQQRIIDHSGRAFLDYPVQEAITALWTNMVNGSTRASNLYSSPKKDQEGSKIKALDVVLEPNRVYNQPLDFWAPPYPPESLMFSAQALDVEKSSEAGQINFAVANKRGSRNTATEINAADQQQQLLTSVQLTLFSTHIRDIVNFSWRIVQSRALLEYITFLVDPITGKNDIARIGETYELRAAGDIDVVQRQEKLKEMQSFWAIVANTPLSFQFLKDMLKLAFPDSGEQYAAVLDQANADVQLIQALLTIIKGSLSPEEIAALDPASKQQMNMILQQAISRVGQGAAGTGQPAPAGNEQQGQSNVMPMPQVDQGAMM